MGAADERQIGGVDPGARRPLDFRTVFELELPYVMRTLRRLGVAPGDLEDMAHEVFMAVHAQLDSYDRSRPMRPWLFGFAFRVASHYRRRAGRERALSSPDLVIDPAEGAEAALELSRKKQLVLDALDQMDLDRRAVFVLHEIDGVTSEETALVLGIPLGTAYSRLRLARQDFAAAVKRLQARRKVG